MESRSLKILLAEDNLINQRVAQKMLRHLGYSADVAENGCEAIEALKSRPYDIVLMDIMMPGMDGFEATRRIREGTPPGGQPRIIAVTAAVPEYEMGRCLDAGMDDYLPKPLKVEALRAAIERAGPGAVKA